MGNKKEAYKWLRQGVHDRADCMVWLRQEPWIRNLREDAEFRDVAKEVRSR